MTFEPYTEQSMELVEFKFNMIISEKTLSGKFTG